MKSATAALGFATLATALAACLAPGLLSQDGGNVFVIDSGCPRYEGASGIALARTTATATPSASIFDRFVTELTALAPGAREGRVDAFLAEVQDGGGTPLRDHVCRDTERAVFLERDGGGANLFVEGTFNDYSVTSAPPMQSLLGTSLFVADLKAMPVTSPVAYKLVHGSTPSEDLRARTVRWDGLLKADTGLGEFYALANPEALDATHGRLTVWRGRRDVFIYVPAVYDAQSALHLPVLYFGDGNQSLTRAPFQDVADDVYAAHPEQAAILVFVGLPSLEERLSQYTFDAGTSWNYGAHGLGTLPVPEGDAYLQYLRDELVPRVDASFRTCPKATDRGLAGASLGGLIAVYGALRMPDTFGYAAAQSGSFFWGEGALNSYFNAAAKLPLRFYLDTGCPESLDNCASTQALRTTLSTKGYDTHYVEQDGGQHDWPFWQGRLPQLLGDFHKAQTGCTP